MRSEFESEPERRAPAPIEMVDTSAPIEWWADNRARLNQAIGAFNQWEQGASDDPRELALIQAQIALCREIGEKRDFSQWQFDILDQMRERSEARREELGLSASELVLADGLAPDLIEPLDPHTGIAWQEANRAILNELIESYNAWQKDGAQAGESARAHRARAEALRERSEALSLSDWQIDLLDRMSQRWSAGEGPGPRARF